VNLHGLVPQLRPYAGALLRGIPLQLTSTRRTLGQQRILYRRYLAGLSRFPAAPPGTSKHERGLAFDATGSPEVLAYAGRVWESWGGRWGGRFGDPIHFELP
jgi:LAS superfamily LD-carboxypeptidase LdcB